MAISVDGADVNSNKQALACGDERQQCIVHPSVRYGRLLCVFVAVASMSRYDTSTILIRSMFLNTRQHCTFPRNCVVLLCVGGACRQSTLIGVGMRVSGPLCDNLITYYVRTMHSIVRDVIYQSDFFTRPSVCRSVCLSLYVCHADDRYVTAFAYYVST